ncbi:MAG: OmpA family protein [Paracoccaceae bacterium]
MQRLAIFIGALAMIFAAAGAYLGASLMADYIERSARAQVETALGNDDAPWSSVRADGLRVIVSGAAPSEEARFRVLSVARDVVNSARIVDAIRVVDPEDLQPPRFSLELLRNGDGISLIGLLPLEMGREYVLKATQGVDGETRVTDMLETADHAVPKGWTEAVDFALASLRTLPRSKISIVPGRVLITALTGSQSEKRETEARLEEMKPVEIVLEMNITAPRPVITPFTLRLIKDPLGTRFDSCSADSEKTVARILRVARKAGLTKEAFCAIGLGAPSPRWADAVELAISALDSLGGGSLTFSDADITLIAPESIGQDEFDRIVFDLEQALPDVFSVHAVLPPKLVAQGEISVSQAPEFTVTKSPEGLVRMRGRMRDERSQLSVHNFADALFGGENVDNITRVDSTLPDGWPLRVMAGLEALSRLHNGSLIVKPDAVELRGMADRPEVSSEVTQVFTERLGDASLFSIDIEYIEALNRQKILPTPEECVARINAILAEQQITFAPSSPRIDAKSMEVVEKIAEVMGECSEVPMEIGGHTDSQGRESMNLTLSQSRAESVLDTLLSLEVLTTYLSAKGYGESQPIADNGTEEGRQTNRRIEFKLIQTAENGAASATATKDTAAGQTGGNAAATPEEKAPLAAKEKETTSGQN